MFRKTTNAARFVTLMGVATLTTAGIMIVAPGKAPAPEAPAEETRFRNSMTWLELAASGEEVWANLGDPNTETGKQRRDVLDAANHWDFLFMICYSLFNAGLVVFAHGLGRATGKPFAGSMGFVAVGLVCALAMLGGDVVENIQLLKLTGYERLSDIEHSTLVQLNVWTRVKWGALFVVCVLMAIAYAAHFGIHIGQFMTLAFAASAVTGFLAIGLPSLRWLIEPCAGVMLPAAWILALVHAALYWKNSGHSVTVGVGD